MAKAITPVMSPAVTIGTPNSRLRPSAAPTNSAMSVDMAMISACTHRPQVTGRGKRSRHTSGSVLSVTIPSLADRYWMIMAIRLAASTTHSRR